MSDRELVVLMSGRRLGHVHQLRQGTLELVYDEAYREDPAATPLLSLIHI